MNAQDTITVMLTTPAGGEYEPVEIPRWIGHVKLGDTLGTGASGVVLSGFDDFLNRRVAVKVLHRYRTGGREADLAQYIEGVRAAGAVKHANLVTVHNVESVAGVAVIVMEYVDGVSLRTVLDRIGSLDTALAIYVMRGVAAGVEALHAAHVLHRDVKPANVMFDHSGRVYVCDLGLACSFTPDAPAAASNIVCGSPLYMAPEAFDGFSSPQSDVYALGVLLFELLTGRPPFGGGDMDSLKASHIAAAPPLHELEALELEEPLLEIALRALHKQRFLRYKTAGHILRALEGLSAARAPAETQRRRLITLVEGDFEVARKNARAPDSGAMTTADLIARRARDKREARGS